MRDYYSPHGIFADGKGGGGSVPTQEKKQKKTYGLRKSGNIRKILKFRRMIA